MKKVFVIFCLAIMSAFAAFSQVAPTKSVPCAEHYEGGQEAMYKLINSKLIYPPVAKRNRMQGECIIGFTINADGSTSNFKIVKNMGGNTGEEALRLAKLLKFKEIGYKMDTTIPVIFKL
jgi:protein TonB